MGGISSVDLLAPQRCVEALAPIIQGGLCGTDLLCPAHQRPVAPETASPSRLAPLLAQQECLSPEGIWCLVEQITNKNGRKNQITFGSSKELSYQHVACDLRGI